LLFTEPIYIIIINSRFSSVVDGSRLVCVLKQGRKYDKMVLYLKQNLSYEAFNKIAADFEEFDRRMA